MAYCTNCGQQVADLAVSCPWCAQVRPPPYPGAAGWGAPQPTAPGAGWGPAAPRRVEGTAVASFILGIAGFVVCPLIPSILAVIFGTQARRRIAADPTLDGDWLAVAGLVLGWIGVAIWVVLAVVALLVVSATVVLGESVIVVDRVVEMV